MMEMHLSDWSEDKLHWPGIEPGADRSWYSGNDPGYHYPTSAPEVQLKLTLMLRGLHLPTCASQDMTKCCPNANTTNSEFIVVAVSPNDD